MGWIDAVELASDNLVCVCVCVDLGSRLIIITIIKRAECVDGSAGGYDKYSRMKDGCICVLMNWEACVCLRRSILNDTTKNTFLVTFRVTWNRT